MTGRRFAAPRTLLAYSKKPGSDYERESEPASLSVALPIIIAAADESRDELQDIWARLLAAAADPALANSFRIAFIEVVKKMDPLDAVVLQTSIQMHAGRITGETRQALADQLHVSRDEIDVSVDNLTKLELVRPVNEMVSAIASFGREFLRAVSD